MRRLRVVSWNVHGCLGTDGRFAPERTAEVLAELSPDVALLQEVGDATWTHPPVDQATLLADTLAMTPVLGITLPEGWHGYGILTLSRLPVAASETYDLSVRGCEPRVCLATTLADGLTGAPLVRTLNLHLGLKRRERRKQLEILAHDLGPLLDHPPLPTVVGGDFNDWPFGPVVRAFDARFRDTARSASRASPTFPSRRPLLRLDRVYVSDAIEIGLAAVVAAARARVASDHLPVLVELAVPSPPPPREVARSLREQP